MSAFDMTSRVHTKERRGHDTLRRIAHDWRAASLETRILVVTMFALAVFLVVAR
jgi:hypothetical protein